MLSKIVNAKVVSEMLGHASIAITLDTCSHVLPTMRQSALECRRGLQDAAHHGASQQNARAE
jgi:hypothetical protein